MRMDYQLAERWIAPRSHILDLGCGNGELLAHLQQQLGVSGYGLQWRRRRHRLFSARIARVRTAERS